MTLFAAEAASPGHPYWWEDAPPAPAFASELPARADIVVIGAGYTGLSAAIAAADGGASVVVLEAGQPGQGASSRNGGMFGAHPRLAWDTLVSRFGEATARGVFAEATPALRFAEALIAREAIDCDLQRTGRIQLAWTAADFEAQKRLAATLSERSDVTVRVVERVDLGTEIATDRYFGGIVFPDHGALQPRKFHDGLLAAVLRRRVPVLADCPVTRLERAPGDIAAHTPRGLIAADKVILATNGYTTEAFPWHRRRVFPLPSFLIATEPLPPNLIGHLAPGRRMMVETRARHSYYRISPDGSRILFGGRAAMRPIALDTAARRLHATMCEVWPELSGTRLTHVWTGNTGYSFTHMPHVGSSDGLHYAMGFSGSGTVMAPYLGMKAALQALGDPDGATAYADTRLATHLLHPGGAPHFLKAADLWYRLVVDPLQNWKARADRGRTAS